MSWEAKHRHIAYQRAIDTMRAWETLDDKERSRLMAQWMARQTED